MISTLIAMSGYLTTVLIDLIRWRIWSFVEVTCVVSPNPSRWVGFFIPNPNFDRNLSSFNTHTAFRQSSVASNKFHRVIIIKFYGWLSLSTTIKQIQKLLPLSQVPTSAVPWLMMPIPLDLTEQDETVTNYQGKNNKTRFEQVILAV